MTAFFFIFLNMSHQSAFTRDLPLRQLILATFERIITCPELDPQGSSLQIKGLMKMIAQKPLIRLWNGVSLVTMNDDDRRIAATCMGIT